MKPGVLVIGDSLFLRCPQCRGVEAKPDANARRYAGSEFMAVCAVLHPVVDDARPLTADERQTITAGKTKTLGCGWRGRVRLAENGQPI